MGVCGDWLSMASDSNVVNNYRSSLAVLENLGAAVVDFKIPCFEQMRIAHLGTITR